MARPTKYATQICLALTVVTAIGLGLSLLTRNPLWAVVLLIPTTIYEVYRTEGESTIWASWAMLVLLVATFVFVVFGIDFDLAAFLGEGERYVAGHSVALGDVKVVAPSLMGVAAVILLTRTRGKYTRWLGAVIFVGALGIVYTIKPDAIADLVRIAADGLL